MPAERQPTDRDAVALALRQGIRAERSRRGISQVELSRRMGWSRSTTSAVETGARVVFGHELPDLCEAIGCTLGSLLSEVPGARKKLGL